MKDKIKASQRVIYSINMAVYTYIFLKSENNNNFDANLHNCHLETFLTHARNLNWFFNKKRQDDIYVGDFTTEVFPTKLDDEVVIRINKSLSHLTYHNIDFKPHWEVDSIAFKIFPNCLQFLKDEYFKSITLESLYSETRVELITLLREIILMPNKI